MNPYSHTYDQRWSDGDPTSVENLDIAREGVDHVKWILDQSGIDGDAPIFQQANTISDTTIASGMNGFTAGPATISAGETVTISALSYWDFIGQLSFGDGATISFGSGATVKML